MDSRIDNELAELKRSQAASFDTYKAELREVLRSQGPLIDKTKVDVEEVRSKIKEIVDYEKLSLQWLINCIFTVASSCKRHDSHVEMTVNMNKPTPPINLASKCIADVRMIDLLPPGSTEVLKNSDDYISLFVTNLPSSQWKRLGFVPTHDIDVPFTHPTLGSVVWRQCADLTLSTPAYRFFFVPTTRAPPAGSDWHIRASNPPAVAIKK